MPWFKIDERFGNPSIRRPEYKVLDDGTVSIPCAGCGAPVPTYADRLVRDLMRGDAWCPDCNSAWRDNRLHVVVDAEQHVARIIAEPSGLVFVKADRPAPPPGPPGGGGSLTVDEMTARESTVLYDADGSLRLLETGEVTRDADRSPQHQGQESDLTGRDQLVADDVPTVHVLGELGDGHPEVDGLDRDAAGRPIPKNLHGRPAEADKPVLGSFSHDSSSVGGDGASVAPSGSGASEPTEEAPYTWAELERRIARLEAMSDPAQHLPTVNRHPTRLTAGELDPDIDVDPFALPPFECHCADCRIKRARGPHPEHH